MWVVKYERHFKYQKHRTQVFVTRSRFLSWFLFQWWHTCYVMNLFPVKRVMRYRVKEGMVYLPSVVCYSQDKEQLRRLK